MKSALPISGMAWDSTLTAFQRHKIVYRVKDFVYLLPRKGKLPEIGQIVGIKVYSPQKFFKLKTKAENVKFNLEVRQIYQVDDFHTFYHLEPDNRHGIRDSRKVYLSNAIIRITSEELEGKCNMAHISDLDDLDKFRNKEDTFWVGHKVSFPKRHSKSSNPDLSNLVRSSAETATDFAKVKDSFLSNGRKLRTLELFGGAGGMALGLELSGAVETKYMVEFAPSPAQTARRNFPGVQFYNEDVSTS